MVQAFIRLRVYKKSYMMKWSHVIHHFKCTINFIVIFIDYSHPPFLAFWFRTRRQFEWHSFVELWSTISAQYKICIISYWNVLVPVTLLVPIYWQAYQGKHGLYSITNNTSLWAIHCKLIKDLISNDWRKDKKSYGAISKFTSFLNRVNLQYHQQ